MWCAVMTGCLCVLCVALQVIELRQELFLFSLYFRFQNCGNYVEGIQYPIIYCYLPKTPNHAPTYLDLIPTDP